MLFFRQWRLPFYRNWQRWWWCVRRWIVFHKQHSSTAKHLGTFTWRLVSTCSSTTESLDIHRMQVFYYLVFTSQMLMSWSTCFQYYSNVSTFINLMIRVILIALQFPFLFLSYTNNYNYFIRRLFILFNTQSRAYMLPKTDQNVY